ncbi:MAG: sulfite exporter TauE/SafE family protein [Hyphomicrobiaceae bacterium]
MTPAEIAIAIAGLGLAGLVKGATGIGYSTTALPIVALGIGLERAMPLVLLPSITSNLSVMLSAGEFRQTLKRFRVLYIGLIPGLLTGLYMLSIVAVHNAARALGLVILAYATYALFSPALHIGHDRERTFNVPVGFLNGFINGLTGSQIMPIVPYSLSLGLSPDATVQLTNIVFTISSLIMIGGLHRIGFLDGTVLLLSAAGVLPGLLGVVIGTKLRKRITPETFRKVVLLLLCAMALLLITTR